jgi:transcriptional regulator with XRE-family HTH domain
MKDRISLVVDKSGLTKTAFAKRINVSQGLISQICAGTTNPSDRTISDICREFRVNEKWLRTGEGPMYLPEADDDTAYINELLNDLDNPFYDIIKAILKSYMEANPAEQDSLRSFAQRLRENKEGRD